MAGLTPLQFTLASMQKLNHICQMGCPTRFIHTMIVARSCSVREEVMMGVRYDDSNIRPRPLSRVVLEKAHPRERERVLAGQAFRTTPHQVQSCVRL